MRSISNLSLLNRRIVISLDDLTLNSIKHIVSIAPQEAQWFHTVTPVKSTPGLVELKLSQKLYIPKQNTSLAEVDSNSSMMIDFYNELKSESISQDQINATLNSMTCWCHSHHNMQPNPSGQDLNQFKFFVDSSLQQNQNNWQIMLIFNKRDEFYSRVYDPETGIIFEGVDIVNTTNYDFAYIDKAAKEKFLRPKPKQLFKTKSPFDFSSKKNSPSLFTSRSDDVYSFRPPGEPDEFGLDLVDFALTQANPRKLSGSQDTYSFSQDQATTFLDFIEERLDYQEFVWFLMLLTGNKNSIQKCFTTTAFEKYPFDLDAMLEDLTHEMLVGFSSSSFEAVLFHVFELSSMHRVKDVKAYLKTLNSF